MSDTIENLRRSLTAFVNQYPESREDLEETHGVGNVWNTEELSRDFEVIGFMAPFCVVTRKVDGKVGSVMFQHQPRIYFNFEEDKGQ